MQQKTLPLFLKKMQTFEKEDTSPKSPPFLRADTPQDVFCKQLLEHIDQGVAVFDKNLNLSFCNELFHTLFHLPKMYGIKGTSLFLMIYHHLQTQTEGALQNSTQKELLGQIDAWLSQAASHKRPFFIHFAVSDKTINLRIHVLENGNIMLLCTDVTRSLEAQAHFRQRVARQQHHLKDLRQRLENVTKKAQEDIKTKTRFLAQAGHDALQPLSAARLYAGHLSAHMPEGRERAILDNMKTSLSLVQETLSALMQGARFEAEKGCIQKTEVSLNALFDHLSFLFTPLAQEKQLDLVFVKTSLTLTTNRVLLERLLQNLIANALKYTRSGRVLVGCRRQIGCRKQGVEKVRIDVYDTGIGITQKDQQRIFTEFCRLDEGRKMASGIGLGLSIVRKIAPLLGATLSLSSTPEKGSHFSVYLTPDT